MKAQKVGKMAIFSVGAVLFSAHAGGGFATGNQANTYYVGMEWTKGNPDLKPSHDMEHRLQFSYNNNRLQAFVDGYFKQCF